MKNQRKGEKENRKKYLLLNAKVFLPYQRDQKKKKKKKTEEKKTIQIRLALYFVECRQACCTREINHNHKK